jgi:DNA-binding transcriptional ArsR family regulator
MPILEETAEATGIKVAASAPLELMWLLHDCGANHEMHGPFAGLEKARLEFGPRITSFWPDGARGFTEAMVLAHRSGTMLDLDLEGFFAGLDAAAQAPADQLSLQSESPSDRAAIVARLEMLRTDAGLLERYRALLEAVWRSAQGEWQSEGRRSVTRAAVDWERRLKEGADYRDLLARPRLWPSRPELDPLADVAADEGRLVLSPGWYFGHIHIVEVGGTFYVGRGIRPGDEASMHKEIAAKVAGGMKALADPTRVGIVLWLACEPASVTDLAKHFKLSQPTVSQHVQVLREAGLIDEKAAGRSALLSVSEERLRVFLGGVEESLLGHIAWSRPAAASGGSRRR